MTVRRFESRWGRHFLPAISSDLLTGSKLGSKALEFSDEYQAFEQADVELRHRAESRPRERGVDADDVPARSVADRFEEISASPVDLRKRDEGEPEIVASSAA
jgi:hypothetical protein